MDDKQGQGVPFVKGSQTSTEAAQSMEPHVGRLASMVYHFLASTGEAGATDDQIEEALDMRHQTASARRRELELRGLVLKQYSRATGKRERRGTRSGLPLAPSMSS